MRGDRDGVRSLLKQGADVNASEPDGMTALHWAADRGDAELAGMLLYAGANPNAMTSAAAASSQTVRPGSNCGCCSK